MSKHWYNNGIIQVFKEEKPDETFIPGMLQNSKDKMKNRVFTENHKAKLSQAKKGKPLSEGTRQKLKGREAWNKGKSSWCKGLTAETDSRIAERNKKISTSSKGKPGTNTGKHFTEDHKHKIGDANRGKSNKLSPEKTAIKPTKQYLTRKKNNTFNTSNSEERLYEHLLNEYNHKTILKQYKDSKRYPFYCDFYIKEDDLFIELNVHWTHGGRPYDPNDSECQRQLLEWQEKAKTSQFYKNAIETWTIRDVKKAQTAKENNLNYLVIY